MLRHPIALYTRPAVFKYMTRFGRAGAPRTVAGRSVDKVGIDGLRPITAGEEWRGTHCGNVPEQISD